MFRMLTIGGAVLLALAVWLSPALARPAPTWVFACPDDTFATLDLYVFTDVAVTHVFQVCEQGVLSSPWPVVPESAGNVWFIWLFVDTNTIASGHNGYCEVGVSAERAEGWCTADAASIPAGHVRYLIQIPDVP
jgi:hypothetical protein